MRQDLQLIFKKEGGDNIYNTHFDLEECNLCLVQTESVHLGYADSTESNFGSISTFFLLVSDLLLKHRLVSTSIDARLR
jgi:hypothetical protein